MVRCFCVFAFKPAQITSKPRHTLLPDAVLCFSLNQPQPNAPQKEDTPCPQNGVFLSGFLLNLPLNAPKKGHTHIPPK